MCPDNYEPVHAPHRHVIPDQQKPLSREELQEYVGWQVDPAILSALHYLARVEELERKLSAAQGEASFKHDRMVYLDAQVGKLREALDLVATWDAGKAEGSDGVLPRWLRTQVEEALASDERTEE